MKRTKKLALSLLAVFALALVIQVPTKASGEVKMKGIADNSVTISWEKPQLSSGYTLNYYNIYDSSNQKYVATNISPDKTSATVSIPTGKGYSAEWYVEYSYTSPYGYKYEGYVGEGYVNTTPVKYTTKDFSVNNYFLSSKKVDFYVAKASDSSGTELQIYQLSNNKKKKTLTTTISSFDYFKYTSNTAYKYRVRSYYTNDTTKKTYYGDWSSWRYFVAPSFNGSYSTASKGINLVLKKGSGIIKYKIQISTKEKTGFKTLKTIKVGKKSKYSYTIKKCKGKKLKKGKTYYIRVVPVLKGSKSSDLLGTASVTFYR